VNVRLYLFVSFYIFLSHSATAQSASDHLSLCTSGNGDICQLNRKQFAAEYPKAYRKDYASQRNVAYCLSTGCDGAVKQNEMLACAWRKVIASSGSPKVGNGDISNLLLDCGKLEPLQKSVAEQQAKTIAERLR
jgi:hypothetical protein